MESRGLFESQRSCLWVRWQGNTPHCWRKTERNAILKYADYTTIIGIHQCISGAELEHVYSYSLQCFPLINRLAAHHSLICWIIVSYWSQRFITSHNSAGDLQHFAPFCFSKASFTPSHSQSTPLRPAGRAHAPGLSPQITLHPTHIKAVPVQL